MGINGKLWSKARRYSRLFALCPFVRMVCVCNSLAINNANAESDIDLFVVTKEGKLWQTRFFLKVLTQLFGARVHHNKKAGRFCLSFFVAENAMNLKHLAYDFDPHLAYFTRMMVPLFANRDIYEKFMDKNEEWTSVYVKKPFAPRLEMMRKHRVCSFFRFIFEILLGLSGELLEKLLYNLQLKRDLERKKNCPDKSGIVMSKDVFKFHENDPRREIANTF